MFDLQIRWGTRWVTVASGFRSRQAAEWEALQWRQDHGCRDDPFRVTEVVADESGRTLTIQESIRHTQPDAAKPY